MNKKYTKRDFERFGKRNTHKRRGKDAARQELMRAVKETEVAYSRLVIKDSVDDGRRARASQKKRRDEQTVRGIFCGSKGGYGFLTPESGYDRDIFIPEDKTHGAIDGDYVEAVFHTFVSRSLEEKTEGRVTKIIEYGREFVIGTLIAERYYVRRGGARVPSETYLVEPDDPRISIRPRIYDAAGAELGDKVCASIVRTGSGGYSPEGRIDAIYGKGDTREANYRAILAECGVCDEFTEEELCCAELAASEPINPEGREVFPGSVIFTIDSEGAKDLDDAVSLKRTRRGWQLGVHIADVSEYVKERTTLDRLVMRRGTSVYFTDKVVPMLPESLSNGACSLNPGEDKYALSAIIELDAGGEILSTRVTPSIIRSRVRGVYSEVNAILGGAASAELMKKYKSVLPSLERMAELYRVLADKAAARGYIDMEIPEGQVLIDEKGEPCGIIRVERGVAERIIEQFMLTANEGVARLLTDLQIPCVYRTHAKPSIDKLAELTDYLRILGVRSAGMSYDTLTGKSFADALADAEEKGILPQVSRTMLRSMMKAEYSEVCSAHFGLGIDCYCHFTSPIRRLSDLATHRIIHRVLIDEKRSEQYRSYAKRAARAATEAEQRALNAERRIENLYKVIYMSKFVGESLDGVVSSVTPYGLFVELDNTCEGLVPISEMPGLFVFNEADMSIRQGRHAYVVGDCVRVRLEEADVIRGRLRFSLIL